jgi:hypothetical protein
MNDPAAAHAAFRESSRNRRGLTMFELLRSRSAALVMAAAFAQAPIALGGQARADQPRVHAAQSGAELQKRAEMLMKSVTEGGGKVTWGALEAGASPDALVMKDVVIISPENKKATIERIDIRAFDWSNVKEPKHLDMAMTKLVIAADQLDKEAADNFRELGLTSLTVNGEVAYKFDEQEKALDVAKLFIDIVEMGEFRMRLKLTGIGPADLKAATGDKNGARPKQPAKPGEQGDQAMMTLLSRLNLAGASIAFKDKSMVERMVRQDAKKKNMTEPAAKAKILQDLAEEKTKAEDDVTREFIEAVIKFVRNPGEIEVALAPPAPANVMAAFMMVMGNRATFKQMMGLSVTVK